MPAKHKFEIFSVYAVRQKSTGLFIPRLKTGYRKGGSHLEPSSDREPRFFHNKIAARSFLGSWLQGKQVADGGLYPEDDAGGVKVIPQLHRKKDDMEIVEFWVVEASLVRKA